MFDKDGSGTIDTKEFRAVCNEIGMDVTEQELQLMMSEVDTDGSGEIDIDEFITAMKCKCKDVDGEELIQNAFDVFDTDGSGSLSYQEMEEVLKHMGEKMTTEQIRRLIVAADADNSGEIEINEFTGMILGKLV